MRVLLTGLDRPIRHYAADMSRRPIPFAWQVLGLQVGLLVVVFGLGCGLIGWLFDRELTEQYGVRALAVAHTLATDPAVAAAAAEEDPAGILPARAAKAQVASGALFVVITDRHGLRLAHPTPELLHERVSTDPTAVLEGHDRINVERGTLGLSARGKTPLRDPGGTIVGEVSVGFRVSEIRAYVWQQLGLAGVVAGCALLLGVAGSALLSRRLKRLTLGLEPHELAELVQEREAVLRGISEGVLAVDAAGRVSVCNAEAARLLGADARPGSPVGELGLPAGLHSILERGEADNVITVAGDRVLVVNYRAVRRDGRDLGGVLTLRDRTDLENITRELESVRTLSNALRASRHEFANRLHVLSGLLQNDHRDEALEYLHAVAGGAVAAGGAAEIDDPYLQAFVAAKTAEAAEKDVRLTLADTSWVGTRVSAPVEVTTVLGILVDNALEAARQGARRPAWVELALLSDADALHVSVADSGDGVGDGVREKIFTAGVSTRDEPGRGLGLALARQAARRLGGDVRLTAGRGDGHGAVFEASLPHALAPMTAVAP